MTSPPPLPVAFVERMRDLLGDEFAAFYQSYSHPPTQGLRVNTLKTDVMTLRHRLGWEMTPVPWCETGFLLERDQRAGKHPFHAAGLFYLQEPAAMAAAELLDVQPGHWVIDVAASPGGKSTHIASLLQGEGLLVANDPGRGRIKALGENLERWGVRNAILTNADAVDLAHAMGGEFDRVLVDAPCSGEGMFRKSPLAVREWSAEHARMRDTANESAERDLPAGPTGRIVALLHLHVRPGGERRADCALSGQSPGLDAGGGGRHRGVFARSIGLGDGSVPRLRRLFRCRKRGGAGDDQDLAASGAGGGAHVCVAEGSRRERRGPEGRQKRIHRSNDR
ncbi:MAG: RsmB/NOP family class I SAM-dependent RNA methyltransferase [Thermomicrobiales bacterium]